MPAVEKRRTVPIYSKRCKHLGVLRTSFGVWYCQDCGKDVPEDKVPKEILEDYR